MAAIDAQSIFIALGPFAIYALEKLSQHSTSEHLEIADVTPVHEGLDIFFKAIAEETT